MKREQLKELGIDEEAINKVMQLHGEHIKELKAKADSVDTSAARVQELETQLSEANKAIEEFKGMNIDGIKKAAEDWKVKFEESEKVSKEKLDNLTKQAAAKECAAGLNFSSGAAKKTFINDLLGAELKFKDGSFLGANDFIEKYKEQDPGVFKTETSVAQVDSGAKHTGDNASISEIMNKSIVGALSK